MFKRTIAESMVIIKKEKLAIVLKELLHLKYILHYYSPKEGRSKESETKKVDMSTAYNSLKAVEKSLKKLNKHIQMLQKSTENSTNQDNIYFLILHSKISRDFSNILYIISLIYKKVYQIFEESYHQYIPKPTLGRRFSSNSLVSHLKQHYEDIIKYFTDNSYNGLILSWSYKNYISLEEKHDKFTSNNGSKYGNYINIPYWYYEIPTLLPSITHECIRIALLQKNSKLKKYHKSFNHEVNKYLNSPRADISFSEEENILSQKYSLSNKIIADIISYDIYKNAYLFSLFHDIAGANLAKLFRLENKEKTKEFDTLKEYIEENFNSKISSYKFDSLQDLSYIRLYVLIDYAKRYTQNRDEKEILLQMEEMLFSLFDPSGSKKGLELIYSNHSHYLSSYKIFQKVLNNISQLYINIIQKYPLPDTSVIHKQKSIKNLNFLELWHKHLKENIHKNELRIQIHKETFNYLCQLNPFFNLKDKELGKPYSLTFIKILKFIQCNTEDKKTICLDNKIDTCFKDRKYYHAFGIYDLAIFQDTSNYATNIETIIEEKFKTISRVKDNQIRFYESKFSLMQIYPTIYGSNNKDNHVSVLYNIDLNYPKNHPLKYLAESITTIANTIKNNKNKFSSVKIFKTLGPGDLILLIEGVSNNEFLQFSEIIIPLPCIKRTFTTILAKKDSKIKIKPSTTYRIVSYIRLNLNTNNTVHSIIKKTLSHFNEIYSDFSKEYIENIHITSGVLDLEIIWKSRTKLETIMEFYNYLMIKKYIRDFQTKFNKLYPLQHEV